MIQSDWIKNLQTSILAFNVAQFLPSLNHWPFPLILNKARFNPRISLFFSNYLVGRKIQYLWNNFSSLFFNANIGIEQGLALSFILLALYFSSIFHIFKKRAKNLKISVSLIFFVDNSLFISQEKTLEKLNSHLFCSYNVIYSLLNQFSLIIEYGKTEVFHFSKLHGVLNPPFLDLNYLRGPTLCSKDT